jgi:hypothetical protein
MASIHPGVIPPLGSRPSNPRPSAPVASRHDDDDDDDDNVTQVVNTLKMRQIQAAHGKSASTQPPPAEQPQPDEKALAVYERPVATLAFSEGVREEPQQPPPAPARPASLAPARIISVGPSEPPPAPSRAAAPSRSATPPPPSSRPASPTPTSGAPPVRARQPSLPSIVVTPPPPVAAQAVTSRVPDSLEPVTTPPPADAGAAEQEHTHAGRRRRTVVTRNLVIASAGSALLASIVTAIAVHRPEPTPLVIAPTAPVASSAVAARPPVRAPEPPPKEMGPAVPVLSLSALPKVAPIAPKVVRPRVEVELAETPPPPSFLTEAMEPASGPPAVKPKTEKRSLDDNPYGVELDDEEPARPVKPSKSAPVEAQEAPAGDEPASAQTPGF